MPSKKIQLTPMGVIEGESSKTGKPFKFFRYLLPSNELATSRVELKADDHVHLVKSGDYYNLLVASADAFEVTLTE